MLVRSTEEIINYVKDNEQAIIDFLSLESISVYEFLHTEFQKGDVTNNPLFQFVYRSFYRLDNAGLSDMFKVEYFRIMEEKRYSSTLNLTEIMLQLYKFDRLKGDKSIQFSFTTKLINTIKAEYPIYDSEVAHVFGFSTYYINDVEKKISRYLEQYEVIKNSYSEIIEKQLLKDIFFKFDKKFSGNNLSNIKKLDFVIWAGGKLK